jgi:hypothetical protein
MARPDTDLPVVVFFNINGSGMGHMSTCLAYANRMRGKARPVFFSLASAIEMIEAMGFEADYFVSHFWSRSTGEVWNRQLALRLGLMLERVRPEVVVFEGTWPHRGFMDAVEAFGVPHRVWSNLVLYRQSGRPVPVDERNFDLVIQLGEIGSRFETVRETRPGRKIRVPPVTVLPDGAILDRDAAREALGLKSNGRYALFSLGPGNLKDVSGIGRGLIEEMARHGVTVVWARAPISVRCLAKPS